MAKRKGWGNVRLICTGALGGHAAPSPLQQRFNITDPFPTTNHPPDSFPVATSGTRQHRFCCQLLSATHDDLPDSWELFHPSGGCGHPPGGPASAGLLHLPLSGLLLRVPQHGSGGPGPCLLQRVGPAPLQDAKPAWQQHPLPGHAKAAPRWVGQSPGRHRSCHGPGEEPEPGPFGFACPGFCPYRPSLCLPAEPPPGWGGETQDHLTNLLRLASPQPGLGKYLGPVAFKPSGPWGPVSTSWSQGLCLSLSLLPLGSYVTAWSPLPSYGPIGNNKAFCSKKKKKSILYFINSAIWF